MIAAVGNNGLDLFLRTGLDSACPGLGVLDAGIGRNLYLFLVKRHGVALISCFVLWLDATKAKGCQKARPLYVAKGGADEGRFVSRSGERWRSFALLRVLLLSRSIGKQKEQRLVQRYIAKRYCQLETGTKLPIHDL